MARQSPRAVISIEDDSAEFYLRMELGGPDMERRGIHKVSTGSRGENPVKNPRGTVATHVILGIHPYARLKF